MTDERTPPVIPVSHRKVLLTVHCPLPMSGLKPSVELRSDLLNEEFEYGLYLAFTSFVLRYIGNLQGMNDTVMVNPEVLFAEDPYEYWRPWRGEKADKRFTLDLQYSQTSLRPLTYPKGYGFFGRPDVLWFDIGRSCEALAWDLALRFARIGHGNGYRGVAVAWNYLSRIINDREIRRLHPQVDFEGMALYAGQAWELGPRSTPPFKIDLEAFANTVEVW